MTRFDTARTTTLGAALMLSIASVCTAQVATSPTYAPPGEAVKLNAQTAARVASAKTVALIAVNVNRATIVSRDDNKKDIAITIPGGIRRPVDAEKAKSELLDSMRKWNRFAIVDSLQQADLVIVVFEDTVEPSRFSKVNGDRKHRLRERLAVFAAGDSDQPLWANEERESTFGALTGSPVGKVVDKFREELEKRVK